MDKYHLHWFTEEIDMHASSAIASYTYLTKLLDDKSTIQSRDVWFVLLSFLTHAAMVSKLFDPINPDRVKAERSKALKTHLEVPDGSAFLPRNVKKGDGGILLSHANKDIWGQSIIRVTGFDLLR